MNKTNTIHQLAHEVCRRVREERCDLSVALFAVITHYCIDADEAPWLYAPVCAEVAILLTGSTAHPSPPHTPARGDTIDREGVRAMLEKNWPVSCRWN